MISAEVLRLYHQFLKGVDYFNRAYLKGAKNPVLVHQAQDFERLVIGPFDRACLKMPNAERLELELEKEFR